VIHYSNTLNNTREHVRIDCLSKFAMGSQIIVVDRKSLAEDRPQVIQRAMSRLGEQGYHALYSNCEDFASWAMSGNCKSEQVARIVTSTSVGVGACIGSVALGVVVPPTAPVWTVLTVVCSVAVVSLAGVKLFQSKKRNWEEAKMEIVDRLGSVKRYKKGHNEDISKKITA